MNPTFAVVNLHRRNVHVAVYLEGRRVGTIKQKTGNGGWYYTPKGCKITGDVYPTLEACKWSLL